MKKSLSYKVMAAARIPLFIFTVDAQNTVFSNLVHRAFEVKFSSGAVAKDIANLKRYSQQDEASLKLLFRVGKQKRFSLSTRDTSGREDGLTVAIRKLSTDQLRMLLDHPAGDFFRKYMSIDQTVAIESIESQIRRQEVRQDRVESQTEALEAWRMNLELAEESGLTKALSGSADQVVANLQKFLAQGQSDMFKLGLTYVFQNKDAEVVATVLQNLNYEKDSTKIYEALFPPFILSSQQTTAICDKATKVFNALVKREVAGVKSTDSLFRSKSFVASLPVQLYEFIVNQGAQRLADQLLDEAIVRLYRSPLLFHVDKEQDPSKLSGSGDNSSTDSDEWMVAPGVARLSFAGSDTSAYGTVRVEKKVAKRHSRQLSQQVNSKGISKRLASVYDELNGSNDVALMKISDIWLQLVAEGLDDALPQPVKNMAKNLFSEVEAHFDELREKGIVNEKDECRGKAGTIAVIGQIVLRILNAEIIMWPSRNKEVLPVEPGRKETLKSVAAILQFAFNKAYVSDIEETEKMIAAKTSPLLAKYCLSKQGLVRELIQNLVAE